MTKKEKAKAIFVAKLMTKGYVRGYPKTEYEDTTTLVSNCSYYFSDREMYFSTEEYKKMKFALR